MENKDISNLNDVEYETDYFVNSYDYKFVTFIRVNGILTIIRQLYRNNLHESKSKLHEFLANRQTFLGSQMEVDG